MAGCGAMPTFDKRSCVVHFAISATWGPTDPTRAMLPFIFAASALQAGDEVTLMLFHDAVYMAVEGAGVKLVPVGPPNRYEEVAAHTKVTLWACKPCIEVRGLAGAALDRRIKLGGMNDFYAAAKRPDARVINY
jgi:tRNA 2-thiouridine synthesizing protein D